MATVSTRTADKAFGKVLSRERLADCAHTTTHPGDNREETLLPAGARHPDHTRYSGVLVDDISVPHWVRTRWATKEVCHVLGYWSHRHHGTSPGRGPRRRRRQGPRGHPRRTDRQPACQGRARRGRPVATLSIA